MSTLFNEEQLNEMEGGLFAKAEGPVTCLGMTFKDDEERRAYFRAELRKKLPELRQIEGFPIGEDDDIIQLSDPPYYTACPNPWLNDIIAEWEREKLELISKGKRIKEKLVKAPYASDVSEGKNNPIYMAHSYHTKCPHTAIMRYILHYTEPGDIVFDGFAGTGMTSVAANICASKKDVESLGQEKIKIGARHSISSDLSPIASLISASYTLKFNPAEFKKKANAILKQVEEELGWMFEVQINGQIAKLNYTVWSDMFICPNCGNEVNFWEAAIDLKNQDMKEEFKCPHCGQICTKKTMEKAWESKFDDTLQSSISQTKKIPVLINYTINNKRRECAANQILNSILERIDNYEYKIKETVYRMPEGDECRRNDKIGIKYAHQFYTKRVLIYLDRVKELTKGDLYLTAWFTSIAQVASKMYSFRLNRKNGIMKGTLYVPSLITECNPYNLLAGKIDSFVNANYQGKGNNAVAVLSATKLYGLADNTIDYMFIDPPFGANLMYSELSTLWEWWIKVQTETSDEAIVNNTQHKDLFEYQKLMNESLKEFYRVLKPGKWLTMEFSNTSASVWNSIQNALQGVGFVVVNVAALDKKQGSFKAITTTTAVKQDLVITCYKPTSQLVLQFEEQSNLLDNAWLFVEDYLLHLPVHLTSGKATTAVVERSPKILYDRLIAYYVQHGYPVPMDAPKFQAGLRERFIERDGMFFTAMQAAEYEEKKLNAPDFVPLGIIVSDESNGVEWLKNQLRYKPQTYQELQPEWMQAINGLRKGDILPELRVLLEENFIQEKDGKWRLPNIQDDIDVELLRTKALLKEFKLYIEEASKPKGKIKEARVEALRTGFKQCYIDKDFQTIVKVGEKIPQNLLTEDEVLLQFYDIAINKI